MKKSKFLQSAVLCSFLLGANTLYAAKTKVDIIFAMDTSGSMNDEATALVNSMNSVKTDLSTDFDLDAKLWGITYSSWGLTSYVTKEVANATSNDSEDWGPAVYDLASSYTGWRDDAIKIIVPISDECPENGDGCDQSDEAVIITARQAADAKHINVLPIIGSPYTSSLYSKIKQLASNLSTVNSKIITTSSSVYEKEMANAIKEIVATATGDIVLPPEVALIDQTDGYLNIFLKKAPGATSVNFQVFEGTTVIQDASLTNIDKISIPITDNQSHDYTIKMRSVGTDSDGQTIYSDFVETQASYKTATDLIAMCGGATVKRSRAVGDPLTGAGSLCEAPKNIIKSTPINDTYGATKSEYAPSQVSDPVDVTTGNFLYSNTDLTIPTAGIPFIAKRFYNSLDLNRGWDFSFINTMDLSDLNRIVVNWGDNIKEEFISTESGWTSRYTSSKLYTQTGFYVVEKEDGTKFKFDLQGKIKEVVNKQGLGYKYVYNGNNIEIQDTFNNHLATIERDYSSRVTRITDANSNAVEYSYDVNGNISEFKNREGQTEKYEYDTNNILYKVIGADGNAFVENTYDAHGRVLTQLDARGNETDFTYNVDDVTYIITDTTVTYPNGVTQKFDNLFNKVGTTDIDGTAIGYDYDNNGKISEVKDPNNKTWKYERNKKGQVTKATNPLGQSTLYLYDTSDNLIQVTSIDAKVTKFEYDAKNNLTKITYADGTTSSFEYDANSLLTKTINQLGQVTQFAYNARGFIEKVTLPNSATISYTYTPLGEVSTVTDPLGNVTKYEYDKEGRLTKVTDALNHSVTYSYNGYGDLIKITDPKNRTMQMEYNTDGLLTKTILPDGNTIEATYDVVGRLIESKDILGRVAKKEYDSLGRVSKIIDPKGNEFSFEYDAVGNLIRVTDANGNDAQTQYDELYRPFASIDSKGVITSTISYNDLSLPTKVEDAVGKSLEFTYDTLNRLQGSTLSALLSAQATYNTIGQMTKIVDPKGYETLYEYDLLGNITKETTPIGTATTYTYDINDRVTSRTDIFGNSVSYAYDKVGRLSKLTYPDSKVVEYFYDDNDNLIKVTDFASRETTFEYDANSNLAKATYPNGAYTEYLYDANDRVISLKNFDKSGKLLTADEITRNDIGDITEIRKTELSQPNLKNVKNFNFEVNEFNQITKSDEGDFTYDNNGNLLSYIYDGKQINLTYDEADSLTEAKIANDTFTYSYDAEGNRVEVTKNGTTTRYLIDNVLGLSKPLAKMDTGNNIETYYIWTNGLGYEVNSDGTIAQYLYDYKDNTNAIIDDANTIKASYAYTSYGKLIASSGERDNLFTSLGKYGIMSDSESLYYVRARYYSPELDRWTQADVKRGTVTSPLSINRYVYNEGDEVNFVDVSGYKKYTFGYLAKDLAKHIWNDTKNAGKLIRNNVVKFSKDMVNVAVDIGRKEAEFGADMVNVANDVGSEVVVKPAREAITTFNNSYNGIIDNSSSSGDKFFVGIYAGIAATGKIAEGGLNAINPVTYFRAANNGITISKKIKDNAGLVLDFADLATGVYKINKLGNTINNSSKIAEKVLDFEIYGTDVGVKTIKFLNKLQVGRSNNKRVKTSLKAKF